MKDLYDKNFQTPKKEIEEGIKRGKDLTCSQIGRITIVKMTILPKAIYRFNTILIKISAQFYTDIERTNFNLIWKQSNPAKTILNNKRTARDLLKTAQNQIH